MCLFDCTCSSAPVFSFFSSFLSLRACLFVCLLFSLLLFFLLFFSFLSALACLSVYLPGTWHLAYVGSSGFGSDNAPATSSNLIAPIGLAIDTTGNLYIAGDYPPPLLLLVYPS